MILAYMDESGDPGVHPGSPTPVSCRTARRVVRRGHYKALADTPDASGFVFVTYRRWNITGDLRGPTDRYVAKAAGGKRVRWLF